MNTQKIILSLFPFFCFLSGYMITYLYIGNTVYVTPNLIGLSLYEAVKLSSPHAIPIVISSEKESSQTREGTIIEQKPSPGRMIKKQQPVFVITTKIPKKTSAPLCLTKSLQEAQALCHDLSIKVKTYFFDYPAPEYNCIGQLPSAHQTLDEHKIILYCAQKKSEIYIMPALVHKNLNHLYESLQSYSKQITVFKQGKRIAPPFSDTLIISNQKPLAGSFVTIHPEPHIQLEVV